MDEQATFRYFHWFVVDLYRFHTNLLRLWPLYTWVNVIQKGGGIKRGKKCACSVVCSDNLTNNPLAMVNNCVLKFIYSEKATKFCEIFTLILSYVVPVKSKVKILQHFVAFSEYINFNSHKVSQTDYILRLS